MIQIYAGYFLALFLFLFFCLDCRMWTKAKINYVFIFEFDSRHNLDWHQLAEVSPHSIEEAIILTSYAASMPAAVPPRLICMAQLPAIWKSPYVLVLACGVDCLDHNYPIYARTDPLSQKSRVVGVLKCKYKTIDASTLLNFTLV